MKIIKTTKGYYYLNNWSDEHRRYMLVVGPADTRYKVLCMVIAKTAGGKK